MNGKIRTPKMEALHRISLFHDYKGTNMEAFVLSPPPPIDSNAFLPGFSFSDADGNFSITFSRYKKSRESTGFFYWN